MQMTITLIVFLFMIVSFSLHKLPMALTSIVGMLVLVGSIKASDRVIKELMGL